MPLTAKGQEILASLEKQHGPEKAKQILYAGKNAGTFTGIDDMDEGMADSVRARVDAICDSVQRLNSRMDVYINPKGPNGKPLKEGEDFIRIEVLPGQTFRGTKHFQAQKYDASPELAKYAIAQGIARKV